MKVSNRKCVRALSLKSLWAAKTRNIVAVLAIALTTVLFTSLFTIALSINEGFQQSNFRQVGGFSHGGFKYLTEEQFHELREDPLIAQWGLRRFVGMPTEVPFNKSHVEVGYSDANEARWMYCDPVEGHLPEEGTNQAATDTHVLELLGVEPELGVEFTLTFQVDGIPVTETFTLCGWWEYDEAIVANHILIPLSRVEAILAQAGVTPGQSRDGMTGSWNMDVMLKSGSRHIERDLDQILANYGYQSESMDKEGFIRTGVNWGYTGAQLSKSIDPTTVLAITAMVVLIVFTGYLIIYNVFQISVAGDIRFYGLLKTIGTTPRQLRRIIRYQALALSLGGIPLGLAVGWAVGGWLTPVIVKRLNGVVAVTSVSPAIFLISALFALVTVLISCRRPGRLAGKVSPVEAVRYTEGAGKTGKARRRTGQGKVSALVTVLISCRRPGRLAGKVSPVEAVRYTEGAGKTGKARRRTGQGKVSLPGMAWANLGRSRGKTVLTVTSLALAVVLLTVTVIFTRSFDMDKYIANFTASDFIVADAGQFQTGGDSFNDEMALPQTVVDQIDAQGGITQGTQGGKIYGKTSPVEEFVTEEYFRASRGTWNTPEQIDSMVHFMDRNEAGLLADSAQLYGMEPFALDHLKVLEGDLSKLYEPGGRYVAAVYNEDDYGNAEMDSHWARLGDTVTLRYVEEYEYYDPDTGEVYPDDMDLSQVNWVSRAVKYRDVDYEVAALVTVPLAFSYRYFGADEFILNDQIFLRDSGTDCAMYYAFDTTEEANPAMESFLADYTENVDPRFDYESKASYAAEFDSMRSMFSLLGGALSFIVALVGVLNFFNAIFTGIMVRRREFAVLQSIGMTGKHEVAALVTVPLAFSYRYFGADEFILNDQTFLRDSGTDCAMYYAFDTTEETNPAMESFLADYTENVNPRFDYESKASYAAEFDSMRSMFSLLGGALSFIVALVGVLNFFNAIFTGIMVRRREFAVLQSIGMTGKQLKTMLVYEGLFYALGAVVAALILAVVFSPLLGTAMSSLFWFVTYRFTAVPILAVLPAFALLGVLVPLAVYRSVAKRTIVERLRETE